MIAARDLSLPVGSIFQRGYEVVAELGAGTFGRVYQARQLSTGQTVAIKILRVSENGKRTDVETQRERFRREMRLCAELSHPNIVRLIDSGESAEGTLYTVFEFVPGSTLREILAAEGKLGCRETLHLMAQVLDALACAHARGVVHRDLKPENIMVTQTGARRNALVLDFGLGGFVSEAQGWELPRLTATREMMGTPCYAAPEQLRGEPPTPRADLYSWGLIFLECLTGELAVGGGSPQEVLLKQLGPERVRIPPSIDNGRLRRLLETVTAKPVEQRDVTIEGLLQTLSFLAAGEAHSAPESAAPARLAEGEAICAATGAQQVDVVGHSLGGLVARYLIEIGEGRRVRRLVTLGSPHYTNRIPAQELAIFAANDLLVTVPHPVYGPHGRIRLVPGVTSAFSTARPCSARSPAT